MKENAATPLLLRSGYLTNLAESIALLLPAGIRQTFISGRFGGFILLLASNTLGGLCFSFIASQRWHRIAPDVAVFTISYAQWLTLGVTVAKLGLDTYLFAFITRNPELRLKLSMFLLRFSVPSAVLFSLSLLRLFSPIYILLCLVTVVVESASVLVTAEQTALKNYVSPALSSLLKYPLFFLLIAGLSFVIPVGSVAVAWSLCFGAVIRLLYLLKTSLDRTGRTSVRYRPNLWTALHHPINFLLFRIDQLVLPLLLTHSIAVSPLASLPTQYAYLAKWPELIAGVASTAGVVWFPDWYVHVKSYPGIIQLFTSRLLFIIIGYVALISVGTVVYTWGSKAAISIDLVVPFLCNALLIVPVNFASYLMLRADCLAGLITKLAGSVAAGSLILWWAVHFKQFTVLAWTIPFQLAFFLIAVMVLSWGKRFKSYDVQ